MLENSITFDGKTFQATLTDNEGRPISASLSIEQASDFIGHFFRASYDWQQNNDPGGTKPTDVLVDALIPVHGLGLAQGIDAQHATIVVGSGPLTVGFHTETTKIAKVCEALQNAPRVPLYDPRKQQKH